MFWYNSLLASSTAGYCQTIFSLGKKSRKNKDRCHQNATCVPKNTPKISFRSETKQMNLYLE